MKVVEVKPQQIFYKPKSLGCNLVSLFLRPESFVEWIFFKLFRNRVNIQNFTITFRQSLKLLLKKSLFSSSKCSVDGWIVAFRYFTLLIINVKLVELADTHFFDVIQLIILL